MAKTGQASWALRTASMSNGIPVFLSSHLRFMDIKKSMNGDWLWVILWAACLDKAKFQNKNQGILKIDLIYEK